MAANIPDDSKNYVVCRNTAKVVKLKEHVLQLLNVQKSHHDITPMRHELHVEATEYFCRATKC